MQHDRTRGRHETPTGPTAAGLPARLSQAFASVRPPAPSGPTAPLAAGARPRTYPVAGLSVPLFAVSVGVFRISVPLFALSVGVFRISVPLIGAFAYGSLPFFASSAVWLIRASARERASEPERGLQIRTDPGGKHPRDMGDEEDKGGMDMGAIAAGGSTTVTKHGDVRIALSRMHASTNTHARTHAHTHSQHMHALTRAPTHAVRCPSTSCRHRSRSSTSTRARKRSR